MKRLLACSYIHGQYNEFVKLLELCKYNPKEDQLILCGDYVDRGPDSKKVISLIKKLVSEGAIALRGNHDDMMIHWRECSDVWLENSGRATLQSYNGFNEDFYGDVEWLNENLKLFYETPEYIFVHAGVAPSVPLYKQRDIDLMWIRYKGKCGLGKTIVHGHTPVQEVTKCNDQIFIDTGSVFGGKLSMIELHTKTTWAV